jgi:hypothetical protein
MRTVSQTRGHEPALSANPSSTSGRHLNAYDDKSPLPPRGLAMLIDWVRKHPPKRPLPRVTGLTPEQRLALEDECNQKCIESARAILPV